MKFLKFQLELIHATHAYRIDKIFHGITANIGISKIVISCPIRHRVIGHLPPFPRRMKSVFKAYGARSIGLIVRSRTRPSFISLIVSFPVIRNTGASPLIKRREWRRQRRSRTRFLSALIIFNPSPLVLSSNRAHSARIRRSNSDLDFFKLKSCNRVSPPPLFEGDTQPGLTSFASIRAPITCCQPLLTDFIAAIAKRACIHLDFSFPDRFLRKRIKFQRWDYLLSYSKKKNTWEGFVSFLFFFGQNFWKDSIRSIGLKYLKFLPTSTATRQLKH